MSNRPTERDTDAKTMAGKVVPLFRSGKRRNLTPLRQVEAYWTALRENGDIPRRSQVSPRGLSNLLPDTFILERIAKGEARFRIAGSRTTDYAGLELRGMPLTALFCSNARRQIAAVLEEVFTAPAVVELHLTCRPATTFRGKLAASFGGAVEAHVILLPLRSDTGDVSRCMGVIVFEKRPVAPLRLEVDSVSIRSVSGLTQAVLQPEEAESALEAFTTGSMSGKPELKKPEKPAARRPGKQTHGMAEGQTPFKGKPRSKAGSRGLHLRLVSSNDTI